ncbi:MAG: 4-hydroxybenzoate 3-monooxygenase [Micromonosporaceae bacterium]
MSLRTGVAILGAGPAGLLVANILADRGVDCLILERHSRQYIEQRPRAGLIEHRAVTSLTEYGLADRLRVEGAQHVACEFRIAGGRYVADYGALTGGRMHYVYPQQELVKDMVAGYLKKGGEIRFEAEAVGVEDLDGRPVVAFTAGGGTETVECDIVAGCDGFHGAARRSIPAGAGEAYEYRHGYGWLAVLAEAPPSTRNIIYALHPDGFAGHMLRSRTVSRFYLQVPAGEPVAHWPDERIWSALRTRLATSDDWTLQDGPIIDKGVLDMRSWVGEPMQFGNLYLAGDAAHILTPAGAKGMNLALGDARELALGLVDRFRDGDGTRLEAYSATRLPVVWREQEFSTWLLNLLHGTGDHDQPRPFADRLRRVAIEQITGESPRARSFAASYVG